MNAQTAGRREWIGLLVLALPCLLISMDASVLDLAVVPISADLRPSGTELLWIVDVYGFVLAGSLITMGTLGDRIGRRRLLLIGAAAFGAASLLAAFSTSAGMLIAARALLGVAGATLMPSTLSLIRNMFEDREERTRAVGVWLASLSLGGAIGPVLGGLLLELAWWGSVFLLAVPVMALLLVLAPVLVPESRDPDPGRLDVPSAALSLAAVLTLIYGLKHVAMGDAGPLAFAAIATSVVVGVAFVRRQRRLEDPLIDLSLFHRPAFSGALAANLLGFCVLFGVGLFTVQYMQSVLGMSALEAGVWMLPSFLAFMAGSVLTPALARRVRPAPLLAGGLVVASLGFGMLGWVAAGSGLAVIAVGSTVFSLGLSPVFTLSTTTAIGAAPAERAGAASGVSETSTELGAALGIAILGSIGTAVYRGRLGELMPGGVPADARDTIGGAVAVSDRVGGALLGAAQEAFTTGLHVVAATSAALTASMAVLVLVLLRRQAATPAS
jgi:MFS transporter, DHA2 family, multidrug resistance protein